MGDKQKDEFDKKIEEYMELYNCDCGEATERLVAGLLNNCNNKMRAIQEKKQEIERQERETLSEILELLAAISPYCKKSEYYDLPKIK